MADENNISDIEINSEPGLDSYVKHLQKKYLSVQDNSSSKSIQIRDSTEFSPSEIVTCSPSSSLTASEKHHYRKAMHELKTLLKIGESKLEKSVSEYENALQKANAPAEVPPLVLNHITSPTDVQETTLTQSMTLPTLASDLSGSNSDKPRKSVRISLEPTTFLESEFSSGVDGSFHGPGILRPSSHSKKFESTDIKIVHSELLNIHMKLNQKSRDLAMFHSELLEREQIVQDKEEQLALREEELCEREEHIMLDQASKQRAQDVVARLHGVEIEIEEKFRLLRECHSGEIEKLHLAIAERTKEYKRLKNSFDVLKNQNDELKAQETDVRNLNDKLRVQNQKLKKRMENLHRKQEFDSCKNINQPQILADRTNKTVLTDKTSNNEKSADKTMKVWANSIEALSVSLDWVSDVHLKLTSGKLDNYKVGREITVDKCLKILPLLVEVIRYLPLCSAHSKHHLPFLRFIYWSLHHLEDTHHGLLSSTARRIGEELIKPTSSSKLVSENESLSLNLGSSSGPADGKTKMFFYSSNSEIRLLSSLIIMKTLHQVDTLAMVFLQMKKDLKDESNRQYFLHYSATNTLLPYLTYKTNKTLLSSAVDIMLQMSLESSLLPSFLELCSCDSWFRAVSSAVRAIGQSGDNSSLEKLSVILQKLSKIKSNKKFFETFSLGRLLQDFYRDCDPSSTFLSLNLRSILFNLNMIKSS